MRGGDAVKAFVQSLLSSVQLNIEYDNDYFYAS